ncbi:hypothetical protein R3P38DRAFT_2762611 [Favolaschia claudopus]|uniref:Uncharacterized protein n=1 Tax=Favolaschia claudopus TaxID=2862362 RepID=A0AAW0DLT8_9AGAR
MLFKASFLAVLLAATAPLVAEAFRFREVDCEEDRYYLNPDVNRALERGFLSTFKDTVGGFPRPFNGDRAILHQECAESELYEFPIVFRSPVYDGTFPPGPDRIVFTRHGIYCGVVTHTDDGFVACPEVLKRVIKLRMG